MTETQSYLEEDDQDLPVSNKFMWRDYVGCVEALVLACDDGCKFDQAFRSIRITDYAYNVKRMLVKQRTQLRRDVVKRLKEIKQMRDTANVGDIVRVPCIVQNNLLAGVTRRVGRRLVEAEIIQKTDVASTLRYTFRRLDDGGMQSGNGHMIKSIVRRAHS